MTLTIFPTSFLQKQDGHLLSIPSHVARYTVLKHSIYQITLVTFIAGQSCSRIWARVVRLLQSVSSALSFVLSFFLPSILCQCV